LAKIIAHRIKPDLHGQLLREQQRLDGDLVEAQILPLPINRMVREIAAGPVGKVNAGAVRHGVAHNGVRPNAQLIEIKADAKVDLLGVGGAGSTDAARVGCGLADVMRSG